MKIEKWVKGETVLMKSKITYAGSGNIKNIYFVLGMHRSATSLTTEIFSEIGLYLGNKEDMLDADQGNKDGYFENKKIVQLNDDILLENNMVWCCIKQKPLDLVTQKSSDIGDILKELYYKSNNKDIVIKDPRFCLTEQFWKNEIIDLGMKPKAVIVVRHPFEVAQSLVQRDNMDFDYALKIWFYYNCCILNIGISYPVKDILFLNHQDFFSDDMQIQKILYFCNKDSKTNLKKNIIKKELRHNYSGKIEYKSCELYKVVLELYDYLLNISRNHCFLTEENVKKFNNYLSKISCTSYKAGNEDMFFKAMHHCHQAWLKKWCINLLQKEKYNFTVYCNNFFKEKNVSKVILYGYGTIAKKILLMINDMKIKCVGIIDKNFSDYTVEEIKYYNTLPCIIPQDTYILNTVVNYEDEILELCYINSFQKNYISLKDIIYNYYKKNKVKSFKIYDICI